MKKFAKAIGVLALFVALCGVGLIVVVEFVTRRSQRKLVAMVAQCPYGTPFSAVVERLGRPTQTFTNSEEIVFWVETIGAHVEPVVATNSLLHTFVHRGPPFRYILIYTDRESLRVVYADWHHM